MTVNIILRHEIPPLDAYLTTFYWEVYIQQYSEIYRFSPRVPSVASLNQVFVLLCRSPHPVPMCGECMGKLLCATQLTFVGVSFAFENLSLCLPACAQFGRFLAPVPVLPSGVFFWEDSPSQNRCQGILPTAGYGWCCWVPGTLGVIAVFIVSGQIGSLSPGWPEF